MNCTSVRDSYDQPGVRIAVREHISSCEICHAQVSSFFADLHNSMVDAVELFVAASELFDTFVQSIAVEYEQQNMADTPRALAQTICRQVHSEFEQYLQESPDNTLAALCWLQKTFVLCRFFSSEQLIDLAIPFSTKRPFVETMRVPVQPSVISVETFGQATSLLQRPELPELYGLPVFNPELQDRIVSEVNSGKYVHALTLICDSPKHGVLSSLINLAVTAHPEWVYRLGFLASAEAINEFLKTATSG